MSGPAFEIHALHHVQLAMPAGQEAAARAFYSGILGLREVPKPPNLAKRGGVWFASGSLSLHLGVEEDFRPAKKAHPALLVSGLRPLIDDLRSAGLEPVADEPLEGYDRIYITDPFGNRIELLEPSTPAGEVSIHPEDPAGEAAQRLITELCAELSLQYGTPPSVFSPADAQAAGGTFLVARIGIEPVGCAALRRLDDSTGEIKRMYVAPAGRRRGVARAMLVELEQKGVELGYRALRLETGTKQTEAIALYASSGFQRIPAFGQYVGNPISVCFEKVLK